MRTDLKPPRQVSHFFVANSLRLNWTHRNKERSPQRVFFQKDGKLSGFLIGVVPRRYNKGIAT
jgi:hypothetical protein